MEAVSGRYFFDGDLGCSDGFCASFYCGSSVSLMALSFMVTALDLKSYATFSTLLRWLG